MFAFQFDGINRFGELRQDSQHIQKLLTQTNSFFLPTFEQQLLVSNDELHWINRQQLEVFNGSIKDKHLIYLGKYQENHYFSYRIINPEYFISDPSPLEFVGLRPLLKQLPSEQAYLANMAIGLNHWHQTHQYCSQCGSPSYANQLGFIRLCSNSQCGLEHFPRTDPAVISAISFEDKILLGRQHNWPEHTFSVIAGFVEPGESLEQAVAREAYEETGIEVDEVKYFSSQPWPFPQSLMVGFTAQATSSDIQLKDKELESAAWFSATEIEQQIAAGTLALPNSYSISRALIEQWLAR